MGELVDIGLIEVHEVSQAAGLVVAAYRDVLGPDLDEPYAAELGDVAGRMHVADVYVARTPIEGGEPEVVGCVTYVPDADNPLAELLEPGEAGIRMLGVSPVAQGRGVGRALTARCVAQAVDTDRRGVLLHSTHHMIVAHRLYESLGFVRTPERDLYLDGGSRLPAFFRLL